MKSCSNLQIARFISREAIHYLLVVLTSAENSGIIMSVRRARDEKPGRYFYSTIDDRVAKMISQDCCGCFLMLAITTEILQRAKLHPDRNLTTWL